MKQIKDLIDLITLKSWRKYFSREKIFKRLGVEFLRASIRHNLYMQLYQTVPVDRFAHSMHGYFILGGNLNLPITYEVDIIRNGKSFTTRRVVAFQEGKAIFNMSASFSNTSKGSKSSALPCLI